MSAGKNLDFVLLLDVYECMLTDRQRELMEYYYCDDMSLGEISENSGITRQAVRDGIKRAEQTLTSLEEKLGLAGKIVKCRDTFDEISKLVSTQTDVDLNRILHLALQGRDIF